MPPLENLVDPRAVSLWRLSGLIRLAIVGAPISVAIGVGVAWALNPAVGVLLGGVVLVVQAASAVIWPALEYERLRYALREHDVLLQEGVLFRSWSAVPYTRIQHVDTRQGPVERALGLTSLYVYTASGMGADLRIPGLAEAEAARLRDLLSRRGGDDGV